MKAAREPNYRPNFFARFLRVRRTYTIGVILEEIGDAYSSIVISGIERYLRQRNVFFLTVAHRHDKTLLATYSTMLQEQGVEGFITVDTILTEEQHLLTEFGRRNALQNSAMVIPNPLPYASIEPLCRKSLVNASSRVVPCPALNQEAEYITHHTYPR